MTRVLYVGGSPFIPVGWTGDLRVSSLSVAEVKALIEQADEVRNFCSYASTMELLELGEYERAPTVFVPGAVWVGIRPLPGYFQHGMPNPLPHGEGFTGWKIEVL